MKFPTTQLLATIVRNGIAGSPSLPICRLVCHTLPPSSATTSTTTAIWVGMVWMWTSRLILRAGSSALDFASLFGLFFSRCSTQFGLCASIRSPSVSWSYLMRLSSLHSTFFSTGCWAPSLCSTCWLARCWEWVFIRSLDTLLLSITCSSRAMRPILTTDR